MGGNNHFNKDLETSVVYKRAVIMIRTLIALSRTLPTHGARLRAMRRRGMRGGKTSSGVTLGFELRDAGEGMDLASAHPGRALGFQTFAFADVPTSIGKLRACVYFLDQMAVSALEEAFIVAEEAMHAAAAVASELPADVAPTPNARQTTDPLDTSPDVALAGGEMSLSPSPNGKGDGRTVRSDDRRRQSADLARGLLFDDASPSPSARPPPMTRGGMTASLSSGALQVKPPVSPAAVPLADYTSPNYQRFDNAPSSAPSAGPAPLRFQRVAERRHSKDDRTGERVLRASTKIEPSLASPKRRSTMSSCLKIDDVPRKPAPPAAARRAGAATPIAGAASSPIFAPGAAKRNTAISSSPSSGGVFPRASPIACSPGLPHASPQSTPIARRTRIARALRERLTVSMGRIRVPGITRARFLRRGVSRKRRAIVAVELEFGHVASRRRRRVSALARRRLRRRRRVRATHERRERRRGITALERRRDGLSFRL